MAQVSTLDIPSTPARSSPASFATLPDELLDAIFDFLPTRYIIPALNRRLVPFNRSTRFRFVDLWMSLRRHYRLSRCLRLNPALGHFVQELHIGIPRAALRPPPAPKRKWKSQSNGNERQLGTGQAGRWIEVEDAFEALGSKEEELEGLLSALPNLRHLEIYASPDFIEPLLPGLKLLARHPKLRRLVLDSREDRYGYENDYGLPGEDDYNDPFNLSGLRMIGGARLHEYPEKEENPEAVVDISQLGAANGTHSSTSYSLRLFSQQSRNPFFLDLIRTFPLSTLQIVDFSSSSDLVSYLQAITTPASLSSLSLFALYNNQDYEDTLPSFINLSQLSLGKDAFMVSDKSYDVISKLPLKLLHLGPGAHVAIEQVLEYVSFGRRRISPLESLILDNIDASIAPEIYKEEDSEDSCRHWSPKFHRRLKDWVLPRWSSECSEEGVKRLKKAAAEAGVKTLGTTFFGLVITETAEYQSDKERREWILQEREKKRERKEVEAIVRRGYY